MEVYEITGNKTGVSRAGVNFLQPSDSYQNLEDGFVYRQVLQSRQGFAGFAPALADESRIMGIFEHILPSGEKRLLAFDQNFAYRYNTATKVFDQLLFAGALAGYPGFAMTEKDAYITGTDYPTWDNLGRFVFTSTNITANAGSAVFFYDSFSNTIKDYTSAADNLGYIAPALGALVKAKYIFFANGRLNFGAPFLGTKYFNQMILFSGIQDASMKGENYNTPGAGTIQATTSEDLTGVQVNGQIIILNYYRSSWTLEITQDIFNPYFIRKVPGALGTNANYSSVLWENVVKSLGKTGILGCDGRENLRVDNKIPYFTEDDISQNEFNLSYGGFDRLNNQFIWSYLDSASPIDTQDRVLVGNYEEDNWAVFKARFTVFGQTDLGLNLTWDDINGTAPNPSSWATWDTTEEIWDKIGLAEGNQKTLAGDDLGVIYELNQDFDDYYSNITNITFGASSTTLTIDGSGFLAGDPVVIQGITSTTELNRDAPYTVTSSTATSLVINQPSLGFTPYVVSSGHVSKPISFYAETIPFNPYRDQGRRCYISMIEFLIDNNGSSLLVDVLADEQAYQIKQDVLLSPVKRPRDWVELSVNQEADFFTIVMKQESVSARVRVLSIRIHVQPAGLTHG